MFPRCACECASCLVGQEWAIPLAHSTRLHAYKHTRVWDVSASSVFSRGGGEQGEMSLPLCFMLLATLLFHGGFTQTAGKIYSFSLPSLTRTRNHLAFEIGQSDQHSMCFQHWNSQSVVEMTYLLPLPCTASQHITSHSILARSSQLVATK